jgi:hypothetical protein
MASRQRWLRSFWSRALANVVRISSWLGIFRTLKSESHILSPRPTQVIAGVRASARVSFLFGKA